MRVTLRAIANRLELSHTTVSRVLNHKADSYISDETRQRVLLTATEMGYRPNHMARALVTGKTHIVGLWTLFEFSGYYASILRHLLLLARADGYHIIPYDSTLDIDAFEDSQNTPWLLDGVLACDVPVMVDALSQSPQYANVPCVSFGMGYSVYSDYVGIDLFTGACEAMHHLLHTGKSRIAYLVDTASFVPPRKDVRYRAYQQYMQESGNPEEIICSPSQLRQNSRLAFREYIEAKGVPDAVFCHNDEMAIGAYRALCDLGKSASSEVSLIGCDGLEEVTYLDHPFSTIVAPVAEMCEGVWHTLKNRMQDPSYPKQEQILSAHLLVR